MSQENREPVRFESTLESHRLSVRPLRWDDMEVVPVRDPGRIWDQTNKVFERSDVGALFTVRWSIVSRGCYRHVSVSLPRFVHFFTSASGGPSSKKSRPKRQI